MKNNADSSDIPPSEQRLQEIFLSFLEPGAIVIDIGAHTGTHSAPIARAIAPSGLLYAIEPLAQCRYYLRQALDATPLPVEQAMIFDCAMGQAPGEAEFYVAVDALGFSGLQPREYDIATRLEKTRVVVHSLDELFQNLPRLDYIKIDAEGGEYHILRGGFVTIQKFRPVVSFEFGANAIGNYGICCEQMGEYWLSRHYILCDTQGRLLETPEAFGQSATIQDVWDYFAIPEENKALIKKLSSLLPGLEKFV